MPEVVINLLHKAQGFDKIVPMLMKLKEATTNVHVISILHLEPRSSAPIDDFLQKEMVRLSDIVIVLGENAHARSLAQWAEAYSVQYFHLNKLEFLEIRRSMRFAMSLLVSLPLASAEAWRLFLLLRRHCSRETLLLMIHNAGGIFWCRRIIHTVARCGGKIVGYLKSVHDQGLGLSAIVEAKISAPDGRSPHSRIDWHRLTYLVVPTSDFARLFPGHTDRVLIGGYPPFFGVWRSLLERQVENTRGERSGTRILIFSRGENPSKEDSEQLITDSEIPELLTDILGACEQVFDNPVFRLKPHPYQDLQAIEGLIASSDRLTITHESPALASGSADVAIATFSSAIVDAAPWSIPLLEYYQPNEAFWRLHPGGSPFGAFGVEIARNRSELSMLLSGIAGRVASGSSKCCPHRWDNYGDWYRADELWEQMLSKVSEAEGTRSVGWMTSRLGHWSPVGWWKQWRRCRPRS